MPIPDQLVTAAQADTALREFLSWTSGLAESKAKGDFTLHQLVDPVGAVTRSNVAFRLRRVSDIARTLSVDPGPGPAVTDGTKWIGHPLPRTDSYAVTLPPMSEFGLKVAEPAIELLADVHEGRFQRGPSDFGDRGRVRGHSARRDLRDHGHRGRR